MNVALDIYEKSNGEEDPLWRMYHKYYKEDNTAEIKDIFRCTACGSYATTTKMSKAGRTGKYIKKVAIKCHNCLATGFLKMNLLFLLEKTCKKEKTGVVGDT